MKTIIKISAAFIMLLSLACNVTGQPGTVNDTTLLSLREAISVALENNHEILIAKNDAEINENKATPGYAGLYPSLDVQGNYTEELTDPSISITIFLADLENIIVTKVLKTLIILVMFSYG